MESTRVEKQEKIIIPLLLGLGGAVANIFTRYSVKSGATAHCNFCPVFSNDSLNFLVPPFLF